jgi:hypothetical protein
MLQSHVPVKEVKEPSQVNVWKPEHYTEYPEKKTRAEKIKAAYQNDIAAAWAAGKHRAVLGVYIKCRYDHAPFWV